MILRKVLAVGTKAELQQLAQQVRSEIFVADDLSDALEITATIGPDLILLDTAFGLEAAEQFLTHPIITVPVIAVNGSANDPSDGRKFVQAGAFESLEDIKDHNRLQEILAQLDTTASTASDADDPTRFFADDVAASAAIVGNSKAMLNTLKMIKLVADSQCNPILVIGETGTGKELAARAIHSRRSSGEQFVAVNCAALTANLLESELFGHVKGSFTGADREKTGIFQLAGSGTLLLDEISEMPMDLQAKLLRVLQERTFRKVGGVKDITCTATIIASSNRDLLAETKANRFRSDLYYRLNTCPITIAPLRAPARKQDIPLLAEYFLKTSTICPQKINKIKSLTKLAIEALKKHDWPGNIRELYNVIERAILLETTDKIGLTSIVIDTSSTDETAEGTPFTHIRDFSLATAERELICRALQETGWQKTQAASLLGITRATLYAKVKQYNIEKGSYVAKILATTNSIRLPEPATLIN